MAWPAADFLARIADKADPTSVLRAVQQVPDSPNVVIYVPLLEALAKLPGRIAARAVDQVVRWLQLAHAVRYLDDALPQLINRLALDGELLAALSLAREVLRLLPGDARQVEVEGVPIDLPARATARTDDWSYDNFLSQTVSALARADATTTTRLLGDLLAEGLLYEYGVAARDGHRDASYVWYRGIEEGPGRPTHSPKESLTHYLRIAAEAAGVSDLRGTVALLRAYPWPIHTRIALHLAAEQGSMDLGIVRPLLLDKTLFDSLECRHEYARLSTIAFRALTESERQEILSWIAAGPPPKQHGEWSADQVAVWQRNRLAPIASCLDHAWAAKYRTLVDRYGDAGWQADHLVGEFETSFGPTSPFKAEDLSVRSVSEIVELLRVWQPDGAVGSATREGLGRALAEDVSVRALEYADEAEQFADLHPTYARSFLSGIRSALGDGIRPSLQPVLYLALRISLGRVKELPPPEGIGAVDDDPDWSWARQELGHLLTAVADSRAMTTEDDEVAWRALQPLLDDPHPTPTEEAQYGEGMGAANYSLNTVRGQAMHATVAFFAHLAREQRRETTMFQRVRAALAATLSAEGDPSLAVRAAMGMRFQQLLAADEEWATDIAPGIFSDDARGRAAWAAFLRFNQVHARTVRLLWPLLLRSVTSPDWRSDEEALAQSLALVVAVRLTMEAPPEGVDDILRLAWQAADIEERSAAIFRLGGTLEDGDSSVTVTRAAQVIDLVLAQEEAARTEVTEKRSDLSAIGWILSLQRFPVEWAVTTMQRLLDLGALPTDPEDTLKLLVAGMARVQLHPLVMSCLKSIITLDHDNWAVYAGREAVAELLYQGKHSARDDIRVLASDLEVKLLSSARFNADWLLRDPVEGDK